MEKRKKRALLARIEGQLAAIERDAAARAARWQRVQWAVEALRALPRDETEKRFLAQLRRHLVAGRQQGYGVASHLPLHQRMLARMDCVAWQHYLRRGIIRFPAAAVRG
ncbi:MAG TPA: hypothetical protein VF254_03440 [Gammaproteobacteria bacterium]